MVLEDDFTPLDNESRVLKILGNCNERPRLNDLIGLTDKDVVSTAIESGIDLKDITYLKELHSQALPMLWDRIKWLRERYDNNDSIYITYSRDADTLLDLLEGTGNCVKKLNISNQLYPFPSKEDIENMLGITPSSKILVHLDSGFKGSLINQCVLNLSDNISVGHLIGERPGSFYREIPILSVEGDFEGLLRNEFQLGNVGFEFLRYLERHPFNFDMNVSTADTIKQGCLLCLYLQVSPKHNYPYSEYITSGDGSIKTSPLPTPKESFRHVNPDNVDPISSLRLQIMTRDFVAEKVKENGF